jgi:hypothetical protein
MNNDMNIVLRARVKDLIPENTDDEYFMGNLADTQYLLTNSKSINYTTGIGPCVGIAICAKDIDGVYHRIVCHCPYDPPVPKHKLEGRVEKYLKSIVITDFRVVVASFNTFFENELSDHEYERDSLIISRINEMLSFWKENHPDFEVEVIQSTSIGITPEGKFGWDSIEEKKEQYLIETSENDFNTIFAEESTILTAISERLQQYAEDKDNNHIKR